VNFNGNSKTTVFNPAAGSPPVTDPYAGSASNWTTSDTSGAAPPTNCIPVTTTGQGKNKVTTGGCTSSTLTPGNYPSGINFNTNSFSAYTMQAGTYYLGGDFVFSANNVTVSGTGVTLVLTGNSKIDIGLTSNAQNAT